jgi:hypothetical protein
MYQDNSNKFVVILNQKQNMGLLMNALAHTVAGLISKQRAHLDQLEFLPYLDSAGVIDARISRYPFIILKAKNGNQIRTVRQAAQDAGIPCNVFADTMLGKSADDQLQKTRSAKEAEMDYIAICLFGPATDLDQLTRKFSLFGG